MVIKEKYENRVYGNNNHVNSLVHKVMHGCTNRIDTKLPACFMDVFIEVLFSHLLTDVKFSIIR